LRVWLKTDDIPGLAMTRSFGDEVAARVGVTCEPGKFLHIIIIFVNNLFCKEILEMDLSKDDKFIVIASDGVWEFMNNDDVANIVRPFFETKNAEKAAEAVVRESYIRWKKEEEGIVDDITCIIVFLDVKLAMQDPSPNILMLER
jgi:serine/threonine protein phosphatase PrpC